MTMSKLFYVYVIENIIDSSWYIGFSTNAARRIKEHNIKIGGSYSRKKLGKWRLIYIEGYANKLDALGREKYLKSGAGRKYLKKQVKNYIKDKLTYFIASVAQR